MRISEIRENACIPLGMPLSVEKSHHPIFLHPVRDARWYLLLAFLPREASLTGCKIHLSRQQKHDSITERDWHTKNHEHIFYRRLQIFCNDLYDDSLRRPPSTCVVFYRFLFRRRNRSPCRSKRTLWYKGRWNGTNATRKILTTKRRRHLKESRNTSRRANSTTRYGLPLRFWNGTGWIQKENVAVRTLWIAVSGQQSVVSSQ